MIRAILARLHQGHRTMAYPKGPATLPPLLRGYPVLDPSLCADGCRACAEACPFGALGLEDGLALDMGKCLFCPECERACPSGAIRLTADAELAANRREGLVVRAGEERRRAEALGKELVSLYGRSFRLRQVSAGGCNACEADTNVLGTVGFDLGRFGISFVASPRHADGILVTGPVSENMREALLRTYEAVPQPRVVIAAGACAIAGGPFAGSPEAHGGVGSLLPVDLYIPGCPPHPITILDGLLRLTGRI